MHDLCVMNAYDFDETIYDGDSTLDFYKFCVKKQPSLLRYLPWQMWGWLGYRLGIHDKKKFKSAFFCFLRGISDYPCYLAAFWEAHRCKIKPFYMAQQQPEDLIISASPEFLLRPLCDLLGVKHLIASEVHPLYGEFLSENCYGAEKRTRLMRYHKTISIDCFYSDSLSDQPLAEFAKHSYLVVGSQIAEWPDARKTNAAMKTGKEFLGFAAIGIVNILTGTALSSAYSVCLPLQWAFVLGYMSSLGLSYFLNARFVFHRRFSIWDSIKFFISYLPNFAIQNLFVFLLFYEFNCSKIFTFTLSAICSAPLTFIAVKCFAFSYTTKDSHASLPKP